MTDSQASSPERAGAFDLCAPEARKFILTAAILASSLGFIDGSMVAIAIPAMRDTLGASLIQGQWISNAYMLTLSALILMGGAAGDRFGLARTFSLGIVIFVVSSLVCAISGTANVLIGSRALQGIGAALMVPGSLALISRAYPRGERGRAIGIWAAAAAVTSALGPIIGGLALTFGDAQTWRWIFAINLPLGGLAIYLIRSRVTQDAAQPERGIDVPGAFLATSGLGLFALALSGAEHGDLISQRSLITGGIAIFILGCFLLVEHKSPHPMVPLGLFLHRGFSASNLISFFIYFAFAAILFYLPMAVIGGWGVTEIETAAAFAPLSVFIAALSRYAGRVADKAGPAPILTIGSLVLACGYGTLALIFQTEKYWTGVMPAMCLQGIGMGLVVAPLSTAVMSSVDGQTTGTASGINNAVTRMAGLIAVAAMGSVVAVTYGAGAGPDSYGALSYMNEAHRLASNASFTKVAWIACVLCLVSAVIAAVAVPQHKENSDTGGA